MFSVDNVSYRYQQTLALNGVTLEIARGQRVALLGANGCGKSTLLRLLDGLYFPASGLIRFCGDELTGQRFEDDSFAFEFRRRVGLVFQNPDVQLFNASVFDEVAFGPLQLRWPKPQIRERVSQALEQLGIAHLAGRPPHRLSGGEKKRVALASVLVMDPEVLLLDEPTAALDPRSQARMIDFLASWGGGRKTVVIATHDLDSLPEIADRCCILQEGQLAADSTPDQILGDTALLERTSLLRARHR